MFFSRFIRSTQVFHSFIHSINESFNLQYTTSSSPFSPRTKGTQTSKGIRKSDDDNECLRVHTHVCSTDRASHAHTQNPPSTFFPLTHHLSIIQQSKKTGETRTSTERAHAAREKLTRTRFMLGNTNLGRKGTRLFIEF
jgi:hypothetical protein